MIYSKVLAYRISVGTMSLFKFSWSFPPVHQARDGPLTVACAQVEFVKQQMFAGETPSLFQHITFMVG